MKKKILGVAILLFGLTAMGVSAQQTTSTADNTVAKERVECKKDGKKAKKDKGEHRKKDGERARKASEFNPFEGIELTADQQTKLNELRESMKTERKAEMENRKAEKVEMKKAVKEGKETVTRDSARTKADLKARKEAMTQKKADYLAKVKEILTPDQYVKFLENNYMNEQQGAAPRHVQRPGQHQPKNLKRHDAKLPECCQNQEPCCNPAQACCPQEPTKK